MDFIKITFNNLDYDLLKESINFGVVLPKRQSKVDIIRRCGELANTSLKPHQFSVQYYKMMGELPVQEEVD